MGNVRFNENHCKYNGFKASGVIMFALSMLLARSRMLKTITNAMVSAPLRFINLLPCIVR